MMRIYSDVFPDKFLSFLWEKSVFSSNSTTFAIFLGENFAKFSISRNFGRKKTLLGLSKGQTERKESRKKTLVFFFGGRGGKLGQNKKRWLKERNGRAVFFLG